MVPLLPRRTATEFRGPGVHHNFDDSDSGMDNSMDSRAREMYDHVDDDKDLENQVVRGQTAHVDPTADAVATPETMSPRSEETHPSTTASKDS